MSVVIGPGAANRAEETQMAAVVAQSNAVLRKTDKPMVHLARI
jgi:hypothetical protein